MYAAKSKAGFDYNEFATRLWGDIYYNPERRSFTRKPYDHKIPRTFVHFILEPLYKIYAHVLGQEPQQLGRILASLGIHLKPSMLTMDVKPLLRVVCQLFFGTLDAFSDMVIRHLPSPADNAALKTEHTYCGDLNGEYATAMKKADPEGPLMIQIVKLYNAQDMGSFDAFGRILSGTVHLNQKVRVLGEGYSPEDEEDMVIQEVTSLAIYQSRYQLRVSSASVGSLVLLGGVDASIVKTATITDTNVNDDDPVHVFRPLRFDTQPVLKVAIEPVNPTELPKMLDGLRKLSKSYPPLQTKVILLWVYWVMICHSIDSCSYIGRRIWRAYHLGNR